MDVNYMLRLKPSVGTGSYEEWTASNHNNLDLLRTRIQKFPMEIMGTDDYYGVMMLKGSKTAVECMYGITLTYAPRKEALGTQFPESTTLVERTWRIQGTPVVPQELEDCIAEVIIH